MNCLGSWRAERCWLQSPPLSCYMTRVLEIFLQRLTIALLLHRISHVSHCVYILTEALPLFTLLLRIAYVELMVEEWKHALVSHLLQNQTKDPWRWQIKHVDQDCAHVWKVDGGNGILLFMNLSPFYLDNMRTWQYNYIYIFSWTFCVQSFFLGHASWACHLFSLFLFYSPCLNWKIRERERERSH